MPAATTFASAATLTGINSPSKPTVTKPTKPTGKQGFIVLYESGGSFKNEHNFKLAKEVGLCQEAGTAAAAEVSPVLKPSPASGSDVAAAATAAAAAGTETETESDPAAAAAAAATAAAAKKAASQKSRISSLEIKGTGNGFDGTYTTDETNPIVNGYPHYTYNNRHLFMSMVKKRKRWFLTTGFDPEKDTCMAYYNGDGPVPTGATTLWRCYVDGWWVNRAVAVKEIPKKDAGGEEQQQEEEVRGATVAAATATDTAASVAAKAGSDVATPALAAAGATDAGQLRGARTPKKSKEGIQSTEVDGMPGSLSVVAGPSAAEATVAPAAVAAPVSPAESSKTFKGTATYMKNWDDHPSVLGVKLTGRNDYMEALNKKFGEIKKKFEETLKQSLTLSKIVTSSVTATPLKNEGFEDNDNIFNINFEFTVQNVQVDVVDAWFKSMVPQPPIPSLARPRHKFQLNITRDGSDKPMFVEGHNPISITKVVDTPVASSGGGSRRKRNKRKKSTKRKPRKPRKTKRKSRKTISRKPRKTIKRKSNRVKTRRKRR